MLKLVKYPHQTCLYFSPNPIIKGVMSHSQRMSENFQVDSDFGPPKKDGEFLFFDFSDTNLVNPLKFSKLSPPKY